jgi:hypothetical protein
MGRMWDFPITEFLTFPHPTASLYDFLIRKFARNKQGFPPIIWVALLGWSLREVLSFIIAVLKSIKNIIS